MFHSRIYDVQSQLKFHHSKTQIPIQSLLYKYPKKTQTLIRTKKKESKSTNLEEAADSSSSQLRMCLTLRRKMEADCLTSLLRRSTTALTPATVRTKFVNPMPSLPTQHKGFLFFGEFGA